MKRFVQPVVIKTWFVLLHNRGIMPPPLCPFKYVFVCFDSIQFVLCGWMVIFWERIALIVNSRL